MSSSSSAGPSPLASFLADLIGCKPETAQHAIALTAAVAVIGYLTHTYHADQRIQKRAAQAAAEAAHRERTLAPPPSLPNEEERATLLSRIHPWLAQAHRHILRLNLAQLHREYDSVEERLNTRREKVCATEAALTAHAPRTDDEAADVTAARSKLESELVDAKEWHKYYISRRERIRREIDETEKEKEKADLEADSPAGTGGTTGTLIPRAEPLREAANHYQSEAEIVMTATCRDVCHALVTLRDHANKLIECREEIDREGYAEVTNMMREGLTLLPRLIPAVPAEGLFLGKVPDMLIKLGVWYLLPMCLAAPVYRQKIWERHLEYLRWQKQQRMLPIHIAGAMRDNLDTSQSLVELLPDPFSAHATLLLDTFDKPDMNNPLEGARRLRQAWSSEQIEVCALADETLSACRMYDMIGNGVKRDLDAWAKEEAEKAAGAAGPPKPLSDVFNQAIGAAGITEADAANGLSLAQSVALVGAVEQTFAAFLSGLGPSAEVRAARKAAYTHFDAAVRTEVHRIQTEIEPELAVAFHDMLHADMTTYETRCAAVEKYRALEEKFFGSLADRSTTRHTIDLIEDRAARIIARRDWIARRIAFCLLLVGKYDAWKAFQQQE